jgi:nucleotide-binding universal stress UspA family protein
MRWIVGIDLRERSHGAIAFVSWVRQQTKAHAFIAAHATPEPHTSLGEPPIDLDALRSEALDLLGRELSARGAGDDFAERGLIEAVAPEDGLTEAMKRNAANGLVVGRRAKKIDDAWIRLGRVARRLLRTLPGPVITIPADLEVADLGRGPVLMTTDLARTSEAALVFAQRLSTDLGRPLHVAHVVESAERRTPIPPADAWDTPPLATRPGDDETLSEWLDARGVRDATMRLEHGHVLERLQHIVQTDPPCVIVCGSRSLSTVDRIFTSSVASALAGVSPVPVAVVPMDWTP